eukprot:gene13320-9156_t
MSDCLHPLEDITSPAVDPENMHHLLIGLSPGATPTIDNERTADGADLADPRCFPVIDPKPAVPTDVPTAPVDGHALNTASSSSSGTHTGSSNFSTNSQDVYNHIRESPWLASRIDFRQFHSRKAHVPHAIQLEPSVGLFMGQLPNSYSEDDIKAMLYAIAHNAGKPIQARSVKSHGIDRTCAFVMLNSSALAVLLPYNKRILCDINCLWVVESSRAHFLPLVVDHTPRHCLRGVPKAPLVLEKLVPQAKNRAPAHGHHSHRSGHRSKGSNNVLHGGYPGMGHMPLGGFSAAAWNGAMPVVGNSPWITAGNPTIFCPMSGMEGYANPPYVLAPPGTIMQQGGAP